jgi:hypothetical protein
MKISLVSLLMAANVGSAVAASSPPAAQIMGTFATSAATSKTTEFVCTLNDGQGEFQRMSPTAAKPNPPAMIAMPRAATYNAKTGSGYKASSGVVVLNFTTAAAGNMQIDFDYSKASQNLPSGETIPFRGYREVWTPSTSTLRVTFDVVFDHCTLPVRALFRSAP